MADSEFLKSDAPRGLVARLLDLIERVGNRLPDPVTIFVLLGALTLLASWLVSASGVQVANPADGRLISAVNLLSRDGVQTVLSGVVSNFTSFAPLGTVLVAMLGIGVAERTGLFSALLKALVMAVPRAAVTPTVVFAGIMSNVASDAGYVILPPLAAMLYGTLGRHPVAGVAAAFAGVSGGFSANLMLSTLDPMLAGLTQENARILDAGYEVLATANYYFMFASVFMLTAVGWFVSDRIVEPRLGPWTGGAEAALDGESPHIEPIERRGLIVAGLAVLVTVGIVLVLVVPSGAPLRDAKTGGIKPFYDSLVGLLMIVFLVPGLAYGLVTRKIRSDRDASKMMGQTMSAMGTYVVMAFFAGQFVAWFRVSELGRMIAIAGADFLKSVGFTGVPLMISFVIVAALINLFMSSASAKWAIMAPVFVPMLMALGYSPEATQCLYRVGDSVTNCITPLNVYFPIIIAVVQRYLPKAGLGTLISAMLPYSIAFWLAWTAMVAIWLTVDLPLGPGAPLTYPPPG